MTANPVIRGVTLLPGLLVLAFAGFCRAAVAVPDAPEAPRAPPAASDPAGQADLNAIWNDPVFQKQFIGGYGINAEIEPRVTPDEVKILEKVRPLMADNLPKAEETLQDLMKPDCSAILDFTLGGIRFQQDKMDLALGNYRDAVSKFPSFRRAWRNLGLIYTRNANYDAAIEAFIQMLQLGPGDAYAYGLLGFAFAAKQDYQPAEAAYRNALLLQPDSSDWRLGLTRCAFKQDKFEDCAALLEVLIARYPENADFWLLQAHTYIGMKQPLKAAQDLESMDRLGKSTVDSLDTLGDIYASEELPDLAADSYRRAIDVDGNQPPERPIHAAEQLAARGALKQSRLVANHVREAWGERLQDADKHKLLKLEARLSMADGSGSEETAAVLEEIVKLDPLDGEALLLLGQHYSQANQPDKAMFYDERAESLEAFEVKARICHAQVLVGMGRYADAVPLLRRAQELKPRDDVARYLEQVERLAKAH